jgi:hypothetical protein
VDYRAAGPAALAGAADIGCVYSCSMVALFVLCSGLAMVESARILCDCVDVLLSLLTSSSNLHLGTRLCAYCFVRAVTLTTRVDLRN